MDLKEFGVYFAKLRLQSGYRSQRELAMKSGVSHSTINRIESGTHRVGIDNLRALAPHLKDVEFEDLMEAAGYLGTNSEPPSWPKYKNQKSSPLIGRRIQELRVEKKWELSELADRTKIPSNIISDLEMGIGSIGDSEINALADVFDVSADYILGRSVSRAPDAGRAFYGGGKDWTPEELEAADAYIEMLRQKKKERQERDHM